MDWADNFTKEFSVSVEYPNGTYQEWSYDTSYFDSLEAVRKNFAEDFPDELNGIDEITVTVDDHEFATSIPLEGLSGDDLADYILDAVEVILNGN